jgi:hypothetical protein
VALIKRFHREVVNVGDGGGAYGCRRKSTPPRAGSSPDMLRGTAIDVVVFKKRSTAAAPTPRSCARTLSPRPTRKNAQTQRAVMRACHGLGVRLAKSKPFANWLRMRQCRGESAIWGEYRDTRNLMIESAPRGRGLFVDGPIGITRRGTASFR